MNIQFPRHENSQINYDKRWQLIGEDVKRYGPFSRHLRKILNSEISNLSFNTLLDVGCGPGLLLIDVQNIFPNSILTGLDFSKHIISVAQKKLPKGEFYVIDITKESLSMQFDVITCSEVLEHIEDDDSAICNIKKMCAKYLLISTPQGRMRRFEQKKVGHVRNYSKQELISKLEKNNFKILKVIEWGFPFYSPIYRNFLEMVNDRGTRGEFGNGRIFISNLVYQLFRLNSFARGDELIILSQVKSKS
jgi:SAM-dependent methyltransferase